MTSSGGTPGGSGKKSRRLLKRNVALGRKKSRNGRQWNTTGEYKKAVLDVID
nr:MAG TPA: hypothetical protein [Caudoviricetes sp.]